MPDVDAVSVWPTWAVPLIVGAPVVGVLSSGAVRLNFVLEVASDSTAEPDPGAKRNDYPRFGIPEYWRFDETGEYYSERLAGERLVDGEYRPIPIGQLAEDILQGHGDVLDLDIRLHHSHME